MFLLVITGNFFCTNFFLYSTVLPASSDGKAIIRYHWCQNWLSVNTGKSVWSCNKVLSMDRKVEKSYISVSLSLLIFSIIVFYHSWAFSFFVYIILLSSLETVLYYLLFVAVSLLGSLSEYLSAWIFGVTLDGYKKCGELKTISWC